MGSLSVKYEAKNSYENVIITNSYNENKCVKLTWDASKIIIDIDEDIQTNKYENDYINEIIFEIEKKNSINYTFYKINQNDSFTEEDFTLVESNECKELLQD